MDKLESDPMAHIKEDIYTEITSLPTDGLARLCRSCTGICIKLRWFHHPFLIGRFKPKRKYNRSIKTDMSRVERTATRLPVLCTSLQTSVNIVYMGRTNDLIITHVFLNGKACDTFMNMLRQLLCFCSGVTFLWSSLRSRWSSYSCAIVTRYIQKLPSSPHHHHHQPLHHLIRTHTRSWLHPVPPRPLSHSPNTALTAVEQLACDVTQIESF